MKRTVIPPRRWVPIDLWFAASRVNRDEDPAAYGRLVEVEQRAQRTAARRRRPTRGAVK